VRTLAGAQLKNLLICEVKNEPSNEQAAFLLDACKLIQYATEQGFKVTGGELSRTPEQQAIYVKTGRSKTMKSIHLKRCAIDLNFFKDGKIIWDKATIAPLGIYWEIFTCLKIAGAVIFPIWWIARILSVMFNLQKSAVRQQQQQCQ
jgi:hypothetical protein